LKVMAHMLKYTVMWTLLTVVTAATPALAKPAALPPVKTSDNVAAVNGVTIPRKAVVDRLWRESGPVMAERFANQVIVRAEARKRGITVTSEEVQERITEFRTAFMSFPGRQPNDWTDFLQRVGQKNLEDDVAIQILTAKVGEYEAARTELTDAEKAHVMDDLERAAHTVKARQILVGVGPQFANRTDEQALARASEALRKLTGGAKWDEVTLEYSDDVSTREEGGALDTVTREQLNREFEDAAFAMKAGEISQAPVKTPVGYVIIAVDERIDTPITEEKKTSALAEVLKRKRDRMANPDGSGWFTVAKSHYKIVTEMPWERR